MDFVETVKKEALKSNEFKKMIGKMKKGRSFPLRNVERWVPRMLTQENVKGIVNGWLNGLAVDIYDEGIVKLISRSEKYLKRNGDYVEK